MDTATNGSDPRPGEDGLAAASRGTEDGGDQVKLKVCLLGPERVGKSSLARRFVYDEFDDRYLATLGAKVSKRVLEIDAPPGGRSYEVILTVWDIMGEKAFVDLMREAYFQGAAGLVAVTDLTRPETFGDIRSWVARTLETTGPLPLCVLGNKVDLVAADGERVASLAAVSTDLGAPLLATSAKTGKNVHEAFETVARLALAEALRKAQAPGPRDP